MSNNFDRKKQDVKAMLDRKAQGYLIDVEKKPFRSVYDYLKNISQEADFIAAKSDPKEVRI
jgi:hypothetical protein